MSEYIKLAGPANIYLKKQLLQTQLETLKILQKIDAYKKLRNEELNLKIAFKRKLEELNVEMVTFSKLLPKSIEHKEEPQMTSEEIIKRNTLEREIEIIKQKLTLLNKGISE